MRIAYFARIDIGRPSGVLKKITQQISCWQRRGHEVKLVVLSRPVASIWEGLEDLDVQYWETRGFGGLLSQAVSAQKGIAEWQPDLILMRYSSYYPFLGHILLNRFPVIIDVNSNYDLEYKLIHHPAAYAYHLMTKGLAFGKAAGFTTLTAELENWLNKYKKPIGIIGDGVSLEKVPLIPPPGNPHPRLVCLATKAFPWIALDKIFQIGQKFPSWQIDIVGLGAESSQGVEIPYNIQFHGFLEQKIYRDILASADVAIGTLGLHRIGLNEMAPLKLREYLAFGLPVIIGYSDTDFPVSPNFILQLPNVEDNVILNFDKLESFCHAWMGKRVGRNEIEFLDIETKEDQRLEFFHYILSRA